MVRLGSCDDYAIHRKPTTTAITITMIMMDAWWRWWWRWRRRRRRRRWWWMFVLCLIQHQVGFADVVVVVVFFFFLQRANPGVRNPIDAFRFKVSDEFMGTKISKPMRLRKRHAAAAPPLTAPPRIPEKQTHNHGRLSQETQYLLARFLLILVFSVIVVTCLMHKWNGACTWEGILPRPSPPIERRPA